MKIISSVKDESKNQVIHTNQKRTDYENDYEDEYWNGI